MWLRPLCLIFLDLPGFPCPKFHPFVWSLSTAERTDDVHHGDGTHRSFVGSGTKTPQSDHSHQTCVSCATGHLLSSKTEHRAPSLVTAPRDLRHRHRPACQGVQLVETALGWPWVGGERPPGSESDNDMSRRTAGTCQSMLVDSWMCLALPPQKQRSVRRRWPRWPHILLRLKTRDTGHRSQVAIDQTIHG